jgi:hypothetical protein
MRVAGRTTRPISASIASLALVATIGLTSGAASAGSVAPTAVPRNVNISKAQGNQAETTIAIDQTNPLRLTAVTNIDTGVGLFHGWSTDGGLTWSTDIIADGDNLGTSCCDPQLASDEFGNIFLTYLSATITVKIAISTDGGATFSPLPFVGSGPIGPSVRPGRNTAPEGALVSGDQPSIAAAEGQLWMSWTGNSSIQASGAAVTGLGQVGPFGALEVPGGHRTGDYGDTVIGPDGQLFIVYQDPTGGEGPATVYGALDPDGIGPQPMGAGTQILVSNVGGFDYIPAQSGRSVDIEAGLAWDRTGGAHDGRLYLMFTSEQPNESDDTDINLQYSDNQGTTWSTPIRVNDDATTNSQFNPRMALDQTTGTIAIGFYDARNDKGDLGKGDTDGHPNSDAMTYATVSTDGGLTVRPNFRLSKGVSNDDDANNGVDYGDYEGLAFHAGTFYYSWADNSNSTGDNPDGTLGTFDLYTARVRVR